MENNKNLRSWLDKFGLDHPLVIAGPCSAETEEQVLKIAHQLISRSQALNEVIASLTESLPKYADNPSIYEVLGDAQMRDGQLNQALQSYKSALDKL